jgi:opine dehydrogenase
MSGTVAILGAGAGGAAAAVDLSLRGWEVRLWNRSPEALDAFADGIAYEGVLGGGRVHPARLDTDAAAVLDAADVAMVCLPALGHAGAAEALAKAGATAPVVLNPGHTGGALHVREVFARADRPLPPLAELSTLTYIARKYRPDRVTIGDTAGIVRVACLPGGTTALDAALALYPSLSPAPDVLATDLSNVNLVLHPPGAIAGAAWVEATGGDFRFYGEGMTPGVVRVIEALDAERRAVAAAFGHALPPLAEEMAAIGTADAGAARRGDTRAAITGGAANAHLKAPDSLEHRDYREDLGYGIVPFLALAGAACVACPTAEALLGLGEALLGEPLRATGLGAERLGIAGLDADDVMDLVGRTAAA